MFISGMHHRTVVLLSFAVCIFSSFASYAPSIVQPGWKIASQNGTTLRDLTSPLWDDESQLWHVWASHVTEDPPSGYAGRIWHYFAPRLNQATPWQAAPALDVGPVGAWDRHGVFTPSAIVDPATKRWVLFYSAVANADPVHASAVGTASAASPFGPWTKDQATNPAFSPSAPNSPAWCSGQPPVRVDEGEPYVLRSVMQVRANASYSVEWPVVLLKSVCRNFTALPVLYVSTPWFLSATAAAVSGAPIPPPTFSPPFQVIKGCPTPLLPANLTLDAKGFEQARLWVDPGRKLHLTGNSHARGGVNPHFVLHCGPARQTAFDPSVLPLPAVCTCRWVEQTSLQHFGSAPVWEAAPVWPKGSVPGDASAPNNMATSFGSVEGQPALYYGLYLHHLQWS